MKSFGKQKKLLYFLIILTSAAGIYLIFHLKSSSQTAPESGCTITQYSDASGAQANFYTITHGQKLIIIDGGWTDNADNVRQIIAEHNNHVDAWIITHPHQDHAGAFNTIYADMRGITIDTIYDNSYDYEFIEKAGEPFDDITVMETFHTLTKDAPNLIHLKRGDKLDICGLTVEVFNAFDDIVIDNIGKRHDYQNGASLCLKVTHETESFLFTSDIKKDIGRYLEDTYGSSLSSTYIQLSHHGNHSLSQDYYDALDARAYFLDAPSSISDNPDYDACSLKKHLSEQGKTVYDLSTAPNSIKLY
ncbi:MAG: ComEC/Rec2 family competence protein [Wujia sp.]